MIHYIILLEENRFQPGVYFTSHFYKKGEGNEIPDFQLSILNVVQTEAALFDADFKMIDELTIEEIILQDVAEITIFFFQSNGKFERTGIYRRIIA